MQVHSRFLSRFVGLIFAVVLTNLLGVSSPAYAVNSVDIFKTSSPDLPTSTLATPERSNTSQTLFASQPTFLPVNEAYKFSASVENNLLILHWNIAPEYYLYQERFTFYQGATQFSPRYSDAILKYDELFERETLLHYESARIEIDLTDISETENFIISYQGCADAGLCYPPESRHLQIDKAANTVKIVSSALAPTLKATEEQSTSSARMSLWYAAFFALLGGIILNIMPCVFPVLSIKILQLTHTSPSKMPIHGLAYTAGILLTFGGLACALIALKATGASLGWGFQLQSPPVIALLFFLFLLMGFALSGVITIGSQWMGAGDKLTRGTNLRASFFTGTLAAVVASPCTAPFMGAAIGYALTQSSWVTLVVFLALGFGMALPMLLLCLFPRWLNMLPKPGAWMETVKEFLAFPLYLSAIWLLWVYGRQTDMSAVAVVLMAVLAIVFLIWIGKRSQGKAATSFVLALLTLGIVSFASFHQTTVIKSQETSGFWQPYSRALLDQHIKSNTPVFVNLTADWCITCLANEKAALELDDTEARFAQHGIVALKGDWTNTDPEITELLAEYGRSGVPLYLWYPAGKGTQAIILPQILTKNSLFERLDIQ